MNSINRLLALFAVASLLSFGFAADSHAAKSITQKGLTTYETFDLRGTQVTNSKGEGLGRISDFVINREGRIILAVIYREGNVANEDGRFVAVPFRALSISEPKLHQIHVTLNVDEEKIVNAPRFDTGKGLPDRREEARIYKYFGQRPYWTEHSAAK